MCSKISFNIENGIYLLINEFAIYRFQILDFFRFIGYVKLVLKIFIPIKILKYRLQIDS